MISNPLTIEELRALPAAVPFKKACRALGLGTTKGYQLAREGRFPVELRPVGNAKYMAPKTVILAYLGVSETAPAAVAAQPTGRAETPAGVAA